MLGRGSPRLVPVGGRLEEDWKLGEVSGVVSETLLTGERSRSLCQVDAIIAGVDGEGLSPEIREMFGGVEGAGR